MKKDARGRPFLRPAGPADTSFRCRRGCPGGGGGRRGGAADAVDDAVAERHDVQVAVWPLFDGGRDAETAADEQGLAFRRFELVQVIGDPVGQAGVKTDVDREPVRREAQPVQAAAGLPPVGPVGVKARDEPIHRLPSQSLPRAVPRTKAAPAGPTS